MSDDVRLQNALTESKQQEDKYQASHPNLRKLNTSGKRRHVMMHVRAYACVYTLYITGCSCMSQRYAFQSIESFQPVYIMTVSQHLQRHALLKTMH